MQPTQPQLALFLAAVLVAIADASDPFAEVLTIRGGGEWEPLPSFDINTFVDSPVDLVPVDALVQPVRQVVVTGWPAVDLHEQTIGATTVMVEEASASLTASSYPSQPLGSVPQLTDEVLCSLGTVLVVGASRGLGWEISSSLAAHARRLASGCAGKPLRVVATTRRARAANVWAAKEGTVRGAEEGEEGLEAIGVHVLDSIDVTHSLAAASLRRQLSELAIAEVHTVFFVAAAWEPETLESASMERQRWMMDACALGPLNLATSLARHEGGVDLLPSGSKIVFVSSEAGSIALRGTGSDTGGGNYGHHMSKAALNMGGRLLALDLKARGVSVLMLHPAFMRTSMTATYSAYYDVGGAVLPSKAVEPILRCAAALSPSSSGAFVSAAENAIHLEGKMGPGSSFQFGSALPW